MAAPTPLPDLKIPPSKHTVDVSIIDTTSHVGNIPVQGFMAPSIPGYDVLNAPCYSFLIKHNNPSNPSKHDTLLFDLGVRKDWQNGPKALVDRVSGGAFKIEVEKHVAEVLTENGDDPAKVGGIIWSHWHFDHTGDPSTFPPTTDLIVGPGFKERMMPAYPTNPEAMIDESAWAGRDLREIDFKDSFQLGRFGAYDFYGDGSFYLLDSPGHAIGHMCALARTSSDPDEFIVMGGDVCHHGGEWRPNEYLPLPENIVPNPLVKPFAKTTSICPGSIFEAIHPNKSSREPFMRPAGAVHADENEAVVSAAKWGVFDAHDNIFAMTAHDKDLFDIVDFYPKPANRWREKKWKEEGRWRFLRDFDTGSEEHQPQ